MTCPLRKIRSYDIEESGLSNLLSRRACSRMLNRAGKDAPRSGGRDDAPLRSVSGSPPCGRKESWDDRRRTRRGSRCYRRGGRGRFTVVESAHQAASQTIKKALWTTRGPQDKSLGEPPKTGGPCQRLHQYSLNATTAQRRQYFFLAFDSEPVKILLKTARPSDRQAL
jgi:hypothetical protein